MKSSNNNSSKRCEMYHKANICATSNDAFSVGDIVYVNPRQV